MLSSLTCALTKLTKNVNRCVWDVDAAYDFGLLGRDDQTHTLSRIARLHKKQLKTRSIPEGMLWVHGNQSCSASRSRSAAARRIARPGQFWRVRNCSESGLHFAAAARRAARRGAHWS